MTKQQAYERICNEYPLADRFEKFFRDTIDYFVGDGSIVTDYCFEQIRIYLNNLT